MKRKVIKVLICCIFASQLGGFNVLATTKNEVNLNSFSEINYTNPEEDPEVYIIESNEENIELLEAEKHKSLKNVQQSEEEEISEEEIETDRLEAEEIKKIEEEKIEEDLEKEVETINELAEILGNEELASKAGLVTKIPLEDIKYILDIMVDSLENNNIELSEDIKYQLREYILSHGPYVKTDKVDEYIEKYNNSSKIYARSSYNRTEAVDYAFKWVHSYNTAYFPNLTYMGGDCTNYVSQAVAAGGYTLAGTWWIQKINSTYLAPKNIGQYRYSWSSSWPDESAWTFAPAFATYWQARVITGEYNASFVADNPQVPYSAPFYKGDIVQVMKPLTNNGTIVGYEPTHSTIITNYSPENNDYRVSYHTYDTKDQLLSHFADSYRGYRIRFYRMASPR